MLTKENFTEKHIRELERNSKRDPILIERTIYAFGLLEAIIRVEVYLNPSFWHLTCLCIDNKIKRQ